MIETTTHKMYRLTSTLSPGVGVLLPGAEEFGEPNPDSVAMTHGLTGTAWQRWISDGLWHRVGGRATKTWEQLLTEPNLFVIYDAKERE